MIEEKFEVQAFLAEETAVAAETVLESIGRLNFVELDIFARFTRKMSAY